ncbi:tRNA (adenosine(37)-N6)-threonylcarbamoyltransferase complex dimerization subunit type 1 TsaB [Parachitinimonas caeni]|uniref:tRNA (Adenosine(37)-N6)-threonylcarbamoyltransferase complex dimerization subunit type 1 TsaB n=1 Tax=Parachitinimonas caeni TaxID=3031301 RepID=A0ABT7DW29_9NEIS|nr:tRNA (adenosine(37)-N6)-threonylcarbamoyltransferase complex dimerization subunit type 1 TsaB [Parachitinimonas caeni]MDK2124264.1 tRNA (adenosine(37)-N6)-threonylcarbamoyltransferase complex dimerization subunit type 1 TsaB [Parachitinimonas caeni]
MKLLALDTSTDHLSLSLILDDQQIDRAWQVGQQHSELTLPYLRQLLADCQLSLSQLDGIAVGIGPGSFTGLRIGCGIVQGLAFGIDRPVVGINTLAALATATTGPRAFVAMDARMSQVYYAAFERDANGVPHEVIPTGLANPEQVLLPENQDWHGIGNGFAAYGPALQQRLGTQLASITPDRLPLACDIARLARHEFAAGRAVAADALELLYVRDKVAQKTHERAKA